VDLDFVAQRERQRAEWRERGEWSDVLSLAHVRVGLERLIYLYTQRAMTDDGCVDVARLSGYERERMNTLTIDLMVVAERQEELRELARGGSVCSVVRSE